MDQNTLLSGVSSPEACRGTGRDRGCGDDGTAPTLPPEERGPTRSGPGSQALSDVGGCRWRNGHAFSKRKCPSGTGPPRFLLPPDPSPLGLRPELAVPPRHYGKGTQDSVCGPPTAFLALG